MCVCVFGVSNNPRSYLARVLRLKTSITVSRVIDSLNKCVTASRRGGEEAREERRGTGGTKRTRETDAINIEAFLYFHHGSSLKFML